MKEILITTQKQLDKIKSIKENESVIIHSKKELALNIVLSIKQKIRMCLSKLFAYFKKSKSLEPELPKPVAKVVRIIPVWKQKLRSRFVRFISSADKGVFVNRERRRRKAHRLQLGIKTNKQYRRYERKANRLHTTIESLMNL